MSVLVDTSVLSLALRRRRPPTGGEDALFVRELQRLADQGRVQIIGAIRQEMLSGARSAAHFVEMREALRSFEDIQLSSEVYERAGELDMRCRSKGVTPTYVDALICSVALTFDLPVFAKDEDFHHVARIFPVRLHTLP